MVDEELVCYLFFFEHKSVSQIAAETKASEKYVRDEIIYCWQTESLAANAYRYRSKQKKKLEWING